MPIGKGQSYRANSFDLGFINVTPVDIILQITKIDTNSNDLELVLVSVARCECEDPGAAIAKWFKEVYPSRSKENCMLKNARAFEKFVDLKLASPEPRLCGHELPSNLSFIPAASLQ